MQSEHPTLHYQIDGASGPLVVLLHGLGSRGADWVLQVEALRGRYRCLTLDLPGHGESPMLSGWLRVSDMASEVAGLLARLDLGPAHLVGLSLGGAVALELAVKYPRQVRSLTIVNSSGSLGGGWRRVPSSMIRLGLLFGGPMQWLGAWVANGLFPGPEHAELRRLARQRIAENSRLDYLRTVAAIVCYDLGNRVRQIQLPTLVVAGDRDHTVPLRAKRALADAISGAELWLVPGSGHATPLDAADRFNRKLLEYLKRVERGIGEPAAGRAVTSV